MSDPNHQNQNAPIAKLPKWAQDHIADLQRQRDTAVKALRDWTDTQTEQPISVDEMECIQAGGPVCMTRYIEGHRLTIKWMGIELSVLLQTDGSMSDNSIDLKWTSEARHSGHVAMIPTSFQSVSLIAKENLRQ